MSEPTPEEVEQVTSDVRKALHRHRIEGPKLRGEARAARNEMQAALRSRDQHRAIVLATLALLPPDARDAIIAELGIDVAAWPAEELPQMPQMPPATVLRDDDDDELQALADERVARLVARRPPAPRAIPPGQCVYFIQAVHGGPIKIGMSESPQRRLADLQVGSPYRLRIIGVAAGGQPREAELHRRLAKHRLHGEWFADVAEVQAAIAETLQ